MKKQIGAILVVLALGLGLGACTRTSAPPLTAEQQVIAERLENTMIGDLVYDTETGKTWRVINRRNKKIVILSRGDFIISPSMTVNEIARWADIVTNNLSEDTRYCLLAEQYLTAEEE